MSVEIATIYPTPTECCVFATLNGEVWEMGSQATQERKEALDE